MSSSALNQGVLQAKINNVQNQADTSAVYSGGVWSFKNSSAVATFSITDGGAVNVGTSTTSGSHIFRYGGTSYAAQIYGFGTGGAYLRITEDGVIDWHIGIDDGSNILKFRPNTLSSAAVSECSTAGAWTLGPSSGLTSAHLIRNSISNGNSVCDFRTSNLYSTITIGGAATYMVAGVTSAGLNMISGTSGAVYQGNNSSAWSTTSDERIKTNIRPISEGLEKVKALKPCHFEYKNNLNKVKTGFIAQEFETVFPGHVTTTEVTEESELAQYLPDLKLKSIDADMIPYLVKAIQELNTKIETLEAQNAAFEARLAALENK